VTERKRRDAPDPIPHAAGRVGTDTRRPIEGERLAATNLRRWLTPGIGVKRWLLVAFAGLLVLSLGAAHVIRQVTRDVEPGGVTGAILDAVTFQLKTECRSVKLT